MIVAPMHHAGCTECWHGYFGEHADWCSQSAITSCEVCGSSYYTDRGAARCTRDHTSFTVASQKEAA